jgi:hypothetical protein
MAFARRENRISSGPRAPRRVVSFAFRQVILQDRSSLTFGIGTRSDAPKLGLRIRPPGANAASRGGPHTECGAMARVGSLLNWFPRQWTGAKEMALDRSILRTRGDWTLDEWT